MFFDIISFGLNIQLFFQMHATGEGHVFFFFWYFTTSFYFLLTLVSGFPYGFKYFIFQYKNFCGICTLFRRVFKYFPLFFFLEWSVNWWAVNKLYIWTCSESFEYLFDFLYFFWGLTISVKGLKWLKVVRC